MRLRYTSPLKMYIPYLASQKTGVNLKPGVEIEVTDKEGARLLKYKNGVNTMFEIIGAERRRRKQEE